MTFLSGSSIDKLLSAENVISNFNRKNIDCNAYMLSVGSEVAITEESSEQETKSKRKNLDISQSIVIPSGQFAYILTEEDLNIPKNIMGFISIKAGIKFRGLVNVSGFHVDPGWRGKLVFAIYNAGPNNITIERGQKLFHIWLAFIDDSECEYVAKYIKSKEHETPRATIETGLLDNLAGSVHSPQSITKRVDAQIKEIRDMLDNKLLTGKHWVLGLIATLLFGLLIGIASDIGINFMNKFGGKNPTTLDTPNIPNQHK